MAPLPYTDWPEVEGGTTRNWKISERSSTGVDDLNNDDVVTFTLASPTMIKLNAITCPHPSPMPAHDAREWKNRDCTPPAGTTTKVLGTTSSGRDFEIVSSEVEVEPGKKRNRLTCRVINPTSSAGLESMPLVTIAESLGGGVCWTAEDG